MYWCIDGFSTCREVISVGSVNFRRPYVPNMGSQTAPGTATWAPCTSTWALQADLWSQETSKRLPGSMLERFRTPPGGPGSPKTL